MYNNYLKEKKISIYEISKNTLIPYTTLNEIVRGARSIDNCSVKILKSLADYLKLSMDELYQIFQNRDSIPQYLYPYFWDVDINQLDIDKDKLYIISRLLTHGGYKGLMFVNSNYTYEDIKYVARNSRTLNPKVASYLMNIYHLKKEDMRFFKFNNFSWR